MLLQQSKAGSSLISQHGDINFGSCQPVSSTQPLLMICDCYVVLLWEIIIESMRDYYMLILCTITVFRYYKMGPFRSSTLKILYCYKNLMLQSLTLCHWCLRQPYLMAYCFMQQVKGEYVPAVTNVYVVFIPLITREVIQYRVGLLSFSSSV